MPPLDLDAISNSRLGVSFALGVGRTIPPAVGHRLANKVADAIVSRRDSQMVRAVRSNLWVVSGEALVGEALDSAARETLRHMARCLYDLYHLIDDPKGLREAFAPSPDVLGWLERSRSGEAVVFVGPHLSNFDLGGRALALLGLSAQVLTVPDPNGGYRVQNELRRQVGLDVTPISAEALRRAARRLASGGSLLTGVDRPVPGSGHRPRFFGRPAELPVAHVRLAARAGAPLVVLFAHMRDDGVYEADAAGPVPLSSERGEPALIANAEAVLQVAERAIRRWPTQWAMPHAVWPEAIAELEAIESRGASRERARNDGRVRGGERR